MPPVKYVELHFLPLVGGLRSIEVSFKGYREALRYGKGIDGSSVSLAPIEKSDLYLKPVKGSFLRLPWDRDVARVLCDIYIPAEKIEDSEEELDLSPRYILKRSLERASEMGYGFRASVEMEFFILRSGERLDDAGYLSPKPLDKGVHLRREILEALSSAGVQILYDHHEVSQGQYEVCLLDKVGLKTADNITAFRYLTKNLVHERGLELTFMPKPFPKINGSGMHIHMSLFKDGSRGVNLFYGDGGERISRLAKQFIGGLLSHAKALAALMAPTVNSYKRLVPGYEAPVNIAYGDMNRSALVRIPAFRSRGAARVEVRMPDCLSNPYLSMAAALNAGLDGIEKDIDPGEPCDVNTYKEGSYDSLPPTLGEALGELARDKVLAECLGEKAMRTYISSKTKEWEEYKKHHREWDPLTITEWEWKKYFDSI